MVAALLIGGTRLEIKTSSISREPPHILYIYIIYIAFIAKVCVFDYCLFYYTVSCTRTHAYNVL